MTLYTGLALSESMCVCVCVCVCTQENACVQLWVDHGCVAYVHVYVHVHIGASDIFAQ